MLFWPLGNSFNKYSRSQGLHRHLELLGEQNVHELCTLFGAHTILDLKQFLPPTPISMNTTKSVLILLTLNFVGWLVGLLEEV